MYVCVCVCLSDARANQHPNHICNSQQPPSRIVHISAYLHCFLFLVSSVHCFGPQRLCLFRLMVALPPGFRKGNGETEKGVESRNRRGIFHPRYPSPKYYSTMDTPPPKTNRTCSFPLLFISHVSCDSPSLLRRYSLPLSTHLFFPSFSSFYLIAYSLIISLSLSSFLPSQV